MPNPIPSALAERWRPMWNQWAHPSRPWWRKAENPYSKLGGMFGGSGAPRPLETAWQRVDGRVVATCHPLTERGRANESVVLGWAFLDPEAAKAGKADAGRHPESGPWATAEEAMAYVDATTPIPAPDPMPGQVWAVDGGACRSVAEVLDWRRMDWAPAEVRAGLADGTVNPLVGRFDGDKRYYFVSPALYAALANLPAQTWPPPGAVLVSGPTPWGRDVPWAPMGGGAS